MALGEDFALRGLECFLGVERPLLPGGVDRGLRGVTVLGAAATGLEDRLLDEVPQVTAGEST
ncbi:hypothetical protein ACWFR5_12185 [Streptomyces sp. NPDC055092]